MSNPNDFDDIGVSLEFLKLFKHENLGNLHGMTTEQVVEYLIRPKTSLVATAPQPKSKKSPTPDKTSYVNMLKSQGQNQYIGKSTVFISHPWRCKFLNLLSAIEEWEKQQDLSEAFLWIDVFSVNQHESITEFKSWAAHFRTFVPGFKHCLVVLSPWDPWKEPMWLNRSWCLFEFFAFSLDDKCEIVFFAIKEERIGVVNAMARGRQYEDILSNINLEVTEAGSEREQNAIKDYVNSKVGYSHFNQRVKMHMKRFLLNVVKEASESVQKQYENSTVPSEIQYVYAKFLMDMGDFQEAEKLLERRLKTFLGGVSENEVVQKGRGFVSTVGSVLGLHQTRHLPKDPKDPREVKRMRRRKWRKKLALLEESKFATESESDEEAAEPLPLSQTMSDYASVNEKLGKLWIAKRWYKACLVLQIESLGGELNAQVASTKHNLGEVMRRVGNVVESVKYLKAALEFFERGSAEDRVLAADVRVSIGNLFLEYPLETLKEMGIRVTGVDPGATKSEQVDAGKQAAWREALKEYDKAIKVQRQVRGQLHLSVADTLSNMATAHRNLGATSRALTDFERALKITEDRVGTMDLRVSATLKNMAIVYQTLFLKEKPSADSEEGKQVKDRTFAIKAEECYTEAIAIEKALCKGDNQMELAGSYSDLAALYKVLGREAESASCYKKALTLKHKVLERRVKLVEDEAQGSSWSLDEVHEALSRAHTRTVQALQVSTVVMPDLREQRSFQHKRLRPLHLSLADTETCLGALIVRLRGDPDDPDPDQARKCARDQLVNALKRRVGALGEDHVLVGDSLRNLGLLHRWLGDERAMREHLERARDVYRKHYGALDDRVMTVQELLD